MQNLPDYDELKKVPKFKWTSEWFNTELEKLKNKPERLNTLYALILYHSNSKNNKVIPYGGKQLHKGNGIHYGPNNNIPSELVHILCSYLYIINSI